LLELLNHFRTNRMVLNKKSLKSVLNEDYLYIPLRCALQRKPQPNWIKMTSWWKHRLDISMIFMHV